MKGDIQIPESLRKLAIVAVVVSDQLGSNDSRHCMSVHMWHAHVRAEVLTIQCKY
jgi:hypothetical protein